MKAEINAATEFLSRIFLAHDNIKKEKVAEFRQRLGTLLEERFRDHWHESCPTKGQAYRCIRINPEECLDPIIEKVCNDVGVNVEDFNLPFELTLWVDPTEVVCKFGDLKCSYHTVAKKDQTSGNLNNQTGNLDIDDLVENARELYVKKQTVVVHPLNSTEMHVQSPYSDGSPNGFTMAVRMNGAMHYNMSGSPPPGFDGSSRSKGKSAHLAHKRGGYHYYGKSSGGKGAFTANGISNGSSTHAASSHHGYPLHRSHNHHHHHHQHHHHPHGNGGHHGQNVTVAYSNGYLNGYSEDNGYIFEHRPLSPTRINGMSILPPLSISGGPMQISQSPPTPEQIQQQLQHPPPIPTSVPSHLTQTFSHPPADISTLPPPPLPSQQQLPPLPTSTSIATTSNNSSSITNSNGTGSGKSTGSGSKFQGIRGHTGSRSKHSSSLKEVK